MKLTKNISAIALAVTVLGSMVPAVSQAAVGDNVSAGGGAISIRFEGSNAGYNSNLELWIGGLNVSGSIFPNHATPVGTTFNVPGTFTAGQLLDIQIHVVNTGNVWHTGSGAGNVDGIAHANVVYNYGGDVVVLLSVLKTCTAAATSITTTTCSRSPTPSVRSPNPSRWH